MKALHSMHLESKGLLVPGEVHRWKLSGPRSLESAGPASKIQQESHGPHSYVKGYIYTYTCTYIQTYSRLSRLKQMEHRNRMICASGTSSVGRMVIMLQLHSFYRRLALTGGACKAHVQIA